MTIVIAGIVIYSQAKPNAAVPYCPLPKESPKMKKLIAILLSSLLITALAFSQTQQKPQPEPAPEDVVRITTNLVQTDLVVTDKNDQVIKDLRLEDFELSDNGK